jgi:hypothetical protein
MTAVDVANEIGRQVMEEIKSLARQPPRQRVA